MNNKDLIKEACLLVKYKKINNTGMGSVGCVLLSESDNLYKGVCIDTRSGMGFCAEHTAISQMITEQEYKIKKIVAVIKNTDGSFSVIAPCGRCREFMYQTNKENLDAEIILDEDKSIKLKEIFPYYDWKGNNILI